MNRQKIKDRIKELESYFDIDHSEGDLCEAGTFKAKEEELDFLQSLLDEPEEKQDAPTHSGWWFVDHDTVTEPVYFDKEKWIIRRMGQQDMNLNQVICFYPNGKWLPANNPFGKGEL